MKTGFTLAISIVLLVGNCIAQSSKPIPRFHVIVMAENGGHHIAYSTAGKIWLNKLAADSNFSVQYIENTNNINDSMLANCQLFIQLDYPPYGWTATAAASFKKYILTGAGGWLGFHHASLLGEFDGYPMWQWFSDFMGGIRYKNYIAGFVSAEVHIENTSHPVVKDLPDSFLISKDEFYTYDKSPRPNITVIASVDESTYKPDTDIKMGDHPVVWTNNHVAARNLYIFMGHDPALFRNAAYCKLFSNAIFWAARKPGNN